MAAALAGQAKAAPRAQAFAHDEATQWRERTQQLKSAAAHHLNRQEIRQQRPVQRIDGACPRNDVRAALAVIGGYDARHTEVGSIIWQRFQKRFHISHAEIETLGADRRKHVSGFAGKEHAVAGKGCGDQPGERPALRINIDRDRTKHRLHAFFNPRGELIPVKLQQFHGMSRRRDPDKA